MSFLERFKLQPKWKSADPDVRVAGVQELDAAGEDAGVLTELAQHDDDVRVRRAAAARVTDVAALGAIARTDPDETLRTEITDRLVRVAAGDAADAAPAALEALTDQRQLAIVAKTARLERVRAEAVAKLTDLKALSTVARKAEDPATALTAAERITDPAELITIAVKTEHKDAGLSALERAVQLGDPDRATLDDVAARAKHKSVGKRARSMVQALDQEAEARRAALEARQQQLATALARVEAIAAAPPVEGGASQLAEAEAEWREFAAGDQGITDDDNARFLAALSAARDAIDRAEREAAAEREAVARVAAARAARTALCEQVEQLRGDTLLDELARARAEWEGLPALDQPEPADDAIVARFDEACRRAEERHVRREEIDRLNARAAELLQEAEQTAALEDSPAYVWDQIAREWRDLPEKGAEIDAAFTERFAAAEARVTERAEARRAAAEKTLRQQVHRVEQLVDRVQARAAAEDLTLREADKAARDLRAAIEAPPAIPPAEREALVERVKAALSGLAPRLHELREMDEWKRFANAAVQEELIAQTEALRAKYDLEKPEDVEKAARELHDIQERWKAAAEAPRAQAQALWHRYRQAADPIQAKAREFFAQRAGERQENLQKKLALCERAEAVADSTDWIRTADELKKLQAEWQQIGPVPRADTKAVWKRFRDACDRFFTRRNADLAQRKEVWAANQAKKEALCARAEELADSREWERTASEIRRLQAEWKTIGPVRRNKSEQLWQRFRTACDRFFDRYKRRDEIELEAHQADREALVQELEAIVPEGTEPSAVPTDLVDRVRALRTRWNQTGSPVRHGADPLTGRFVAALERLQTTYPESFRGTELDADASRQRMEKLCARVEGLAAEAPAPEAGSSEALAAMLREALAANTIGGRAGEETKWRTMADEVRQAQASWSRLAPVPGDAGRQLTERFHKACNRFFDQYRRRVPQGDRRGRPVATR
ncbi:MAG TPA: DUF349 domain-containing protein [Vicinamibacterales bacterium]|nr:DUF349 domain-containing protein [Vicinamibacterales bacterium]